METRTSTAITRLTEAIKMVEFKDQQLAELHLKLQERDQQIYALKNELLAAKDILHQSSREITRLQQLTRNRLT